MQPWFNQNPFAIGPSPSPSPPPLSPTAIDFNQRNNGFEEKSPAPAEPEEPTPGGYQSWLSGKRLCFVIGFLFILLVLIVVIPVTVFAAQHSHPPAPTEPFTMLADLRTLPTASTSIIEAPKPTKTIVEKPLRSKGPGCDKRRKT